MPWTSGTISNTTAGEQYQEFNLETAGTAVYAKLLHRLKAFLCGEASAWVFTPTGSANGFIRGLEVTKATVTKAWTFTFSTDASFVASASGEASTVWNLTGSAGNRYVTVNHPCFTCRVYEGDVPFLAGDTFTFTTTASPLGAQTWEVISDTAKGSGSYLGDYNAAAGSRSDVIGLIGPTLSGTTTNRGVLKNLRYYDQQYFNQVFYITFLSGGLTFNVRDSSGTIVGSTGTVGTTWEWGTTGSRMSLLVEAGSTAFTQTTYTGSLPTGGNYYTLTPRSSGTTITNSHLTRIMTLKSTGYSGDDVIYYTLAQRVGGAFARFYLDLVVHKTHDQSLPTYGQVGTSPVSRIRMSQGAHLTTYHFIGNGRYFYLLSLPASGDPQCLGGGLLLPHAMPIAEEEFLWPAFCGGTYQDTTTEAAGTTGASIGMPFFCPQGSEGSISSLYVVIPGFTIIWVPGINHTATPTGGNAIASSTTSVKEAVVTYPWQEAANYSTLKYHSGVFGEIGSRKAPIPGLIFMRGSTVSGVLGEFPGLFFIGGSSDSYQVALGDTLDSGAYLIWRGGAGFDSSSVQNTAVFALE